jgi:hypothetical protein
MQYILNTNEILVIYWMTIGYIDLFVSCEGILTISYIENMYLWLLVILIWWRSRCVGELIRVW